MADKMIFPIGFDLEAAVKKASTDWESKYADKLEKAIQKRALGVKLSLSTKIFDSLEDVKKRLAELKLEPITPETKTAIKELAAELRTLARALQEVQKYSTRAGGTPEAVRNSKILANEAKASAARELARQRAARASLAEDKLAAARERAGLSAERNAKRTQKANQEFKNQDGYISRLLKRLAVYASFSAVSNFLTSVREVTAQFELQRISLGAIIQDQVKANALFSEIKQFALKSPVSIMDLTKYTKQLAAYKFETEELFNWTKRLTDISVGLSVPMERIVLLAGQVRATGYLRGSEVRQATEAGIPLVEELAAKLSKMNGELVTAKDVMDMISKRQISWEMVSDVFRDMTSAGGMFYNMQEKQGNTLFGLWAKLGDAASVMYDEIGNTDDVNSAMKGTIELLTELMRNWREVGRTMAVAGVGIAALWATKKVKGWQGNIDAARITANQKYIAASNAYRSAIMSEQAARASATAEEYRSIAAKTASAEASYSAARAEYLAARNTTLWSKAWGKLKTAFLGNWVTLLIAGVAALGMHLYSASEKANRLKKALKEIEEESSIEQMKSVRNFEALATVAVQAADGSKKQKDALDELLRTYKDIIPQERLTIENLRAMKGNYDSLTESIRTYIAEQMKQKQINSVLETTGKEMIDNTRKIQDWMKDTWSYEQITRFMAAYEQAIRENPAISYFEAVAKAAENTGVSMNDLLKMGATSNVYFKGYLEDFANALKEQIAQVDALDAAWNNNYMALGKYGNEYERLANKVKENPIAMGGSPKLDEQKTPYYFKQQQQNLEILKVMIPTLKQIMSDANVAWQEGWTNIIETIDTAQPQVISSINFNAINRYLQDNITALSDEQRKAIVKLQEIYLNIGIPNEVVQYNRKAAIDLANSMSDALSKIGDGSRTALDNVTKYFMTSGQSVNDYAKTLDDALKNLKERITELSAVGLMLSPESRKELEDLKTAAEFVEKLRNLISKGVTASTESQRTASQPAERDGRVQTLREMERALREMLERYEELEKRMGASEAGKWAEHTYKQELKYMKLLAKDIGFDFDFKVPKNIKQLNEYQTQIWNALNKIGTKVAHRSMIDLGKVMDSDWLKHQQAVVDKRMSELADRISRTKTAREFYEKILSQTGDVELAAQVTMSVYGDTGEGLFDSMVEQIRQTFTSGDKDIDLQIGAEIDTAIDTENQRINYKALADIYAKYQDQIIEKNRDTAQKIVSEGQKTAASNIAAWEKELAKAKSFEEQRTDIINRETQRRAEIIKSNLPQEEKDRLIGQSQNQQDKEISDLNWKEFKESDDYIKIFENLDNVSTAALRRLRENLEEVKTANADLSPENMKALVKAMEDIDNQLDERGFGNVMVQSVKDYIQAMRDLKTAKAELQATQAEYDAQEPMLDAEIDAAKQEEIAAQTALNRLKASGLATDNQILAAELRLNAATSNVAKAENKKARAADKVKKAEQKVTDQQDKQKKATSKFFKDMQQVAQTADQLASELSDVKDLLGISEDSAAGLVFDSAVSGLQAVSKAIAVVTAAQAIYNAVCESNPYIAAAAGVLAVFSAIGSFLTSNKVRRANKEIKRQQELLDQLEYTYGRLEKAAEKAFGGDFISNFKAQQKNLQAQAAAYQKQANAERSKGKKADEDKIKEYEEKYRETMDAIADMDGEIGAKMLGTTLEDKARDAAKAWLEAYKTIGRAGAETTKAMKEQFQDMVENMVVEGALASVMQRALQPMFDMIDNMGEQDFYSESFWKNVVAKAEQGAKDADAGASTLMKFLEQAGISMRDMGTEFTGIKRDIATASEESINGLAAHMNTVEHYVALIQRDVAAMAMGSGERRVESGGMSVDYTPLIQQSLANQSMMIRYQAETVTECKRSAAAAESILAELRKVIVTPGTTGTRQIYVRM